MTDLAYEDDEEDRLRREAEARALRELQSADALERIGASADTAAATVAPTQRPTTDDERHDMLADMPGVNAVSVGGPGIPTRRVRGFADPEPQPPETQVATTPAPTTPAPTTPTPTPTPTPTNDLAPMMKRESPARMTALEGESPSQRDPRTDELQEEVDAARTRDRRRDIVGRVLQGILGLASIAPAARGNFAGAAALQGAARGVGAGFGAAPTREQQVIGDQRRAMAGRQQALSEERQSEALQGARADRQFRERRLGLQELQTEMDARRQAQRDDIERRRAERALILAEVQTRRTEDIVERERAMHDPESDVSRAAQAVVAANTEMFPDAAELDLQSMSRADLQPYIQALGHRRDTRVRGQQRAPGVGRVALERRAQAARILEQQGMGREEAQAQARLLPLREVNRLLSEYSRQAIRQRPEEEGAQGVELLPGVTSPMDIGSTEARSVREAFERARARLGSLRDVSQIADHYGLRARISPEAGAQVRPLLMDLRALAAEIQGTGVINPGEVEVINAALPNPDSLVGQTFGTIQTSVATWQRMLERRFIAGLQARGVDAEGQRRALQMLRGAAGGRVRRGGGQGPRGGGERMVIIRRVRDGETRRLPAGDSRVDVFRQDSGYEVQEAP